MRCVSTKRPFDRPVKTVSCRTRARPTKWRRGSTRRAARNGSPIPVCVTPGTAISAGARTARSSNSTNATRICARKGPATSGAATIGAPVAQLDVETAIKASQAVSGEIVLENLIKTLMVIAVEHAGAERGVLILPRGDQLWVEAEVTTGLKTVEVNLRQALVAPSELPLSILQYVIRTQEPVIADDASREKPFSADEYVASRRVRSVLCLPLIKQAKLVGVLYLENNVAGSVFTPARIALLKLLASQAAISLENARLYGELTMSEERWRKLFESVPVGVGLIGSHRRYIATNPAFQRMTRLFRGGTPSPLARRHHLRGRSSRDRGNRRGQMPRASHSRGVSRSATGGRMAA